MFLGDAGNIGFDLSYGIKNMHQIETIVPLH